MTNDSFHWPQANAFYDRAERLNLHGLHFQHINLCERRAKAGPRLASISPNPSNPFW